MIYLILYILSVLLAGGTFFSLNLKRRWVTKTELRSFDGEMVAACIILGILFWPIALIMIGCAMAWKWIVKTVFPE